jgi:hypothetical protein
MRDQFSQNERDAVDAFPIAARQFCEFVDASTTYDLRQVLHELPILLACLCEVGAGLPAVTPATDAVETNSQTTAVYLQKRNSLEASFAEKLGTLDVYWQVFDPTVRDAPVRGLLSADIAEIYLDLQDSLGLLENVAAESDVYWQWHFDFWSHWSRHAADALKVILLLSGRM